MHALKSTYILVLALSGLVANASSFQVMCHTGEASGTRPPANGGPGTNPGSGSTGSGYTGGGYTGGGGGGYTGDGGMGSSIGIVPIGSAPPGPGGYNGAGYNSDGTPRPLPAIYNPGNGGGTISYPSYGAPILIGGVPTVTFEGGGAGNGSDQIVPAALSQSQQKTAMKAYIQSLPPVQINDRDQPMASKGWAQRKATKKEFKKFTKFMQAHPGLNCSAGTPGMTCVSSDGSTKKFPRLNQNSVAHALVKAGSAQNNYASGSAGHVSDTVGKVNNDANASFDQYLNSNKNIVQVGTPIQTVFDAPVAVLPSSTLRGPAASVSVGYEGQSQGSH